MPQSFTSTELKGIVQDAVDHFVKGPIESFPPKSPFWGGGVYALYYLGGFELYKDIKISEVKQDSIPIYVGKSNPSGWRTARVSTTKDRKLYSRISVLRQPVLLHLLEISLPIRGLLRHYDTYRAVSYFSGIINPNFSMVLSVGLLYRIQWLNQTIL